MCCVIINMVTIVLSYIDIPDDVQSDINTLDDVLLYIYTGEAILKIIGLGPLNYFRDPWNVLDFILVIISLMVDVTFNFLKTLRSLKIAKTLRITKVLKAQRAIWVIWIFWGLKLISKFKKYLLGFSSVKWIASIIKNSVACLMTLQSVLATLTLFVYIFAVIAPEAFYMDDVHFKIRTYYSEDWEELAYYFIGAYGNFRSFNMSLYAIF